MSEMLLSSLSEILEVQKQLYQTKSARPSLPPPEWEGLQVAPSCRMTVTKNVIMPTEQGMAVSARAW